MSHFFDGAFPATTVRHGSAEFELPIRYYRDDAFVLAFSADPEALRAQFPSDQLHPVMLSRHRALVLIAAFNYIDTSIGPYGEVGVVAAVVHGRKPPPLLPALMEGDFPHFGGLVLHLPVTSQRARDGGRGEWGYTKFVAQMSFINTPEQLSCKVTEAGRHVLTLTSAKGGFFGREKRPICTYSVKDHNLIKTVIPQVGSHRWWPRCRRSSLELGDHPVAKSIRELDLSPEPIFRRYYLERAAILPAGEVVERGVRPLDGYMGIDGDAEHEVTYLGLAS